MDLGMKIYILHQACEFISSDPFFFSFQARAKHDITNTFVAGCTTGAAISAKGNPLFHLFSVIYYVFVSNKPVFK